MIRKLTNYFKREIKLQKFKPVVLVTGCASGLGHAIAELLYSQIQYRVVITARTHSIEELKNRFPESDRFLIRALDVTSEVDRISLINEIEGIWGGVQILINNAGISYRSVVEHMTEADEVLQMATNYLGPIGLIRLVLPTMRKQGRGKIINISSVSGMLAMPTMASYSASKFALEGACEALWYECRPLGIDISLVQPGFIRSNSFKRVCLTKASNVQLNLESAYKDYYENMTPFIEKMMQKSFSCPQKIALKVLSTIQKEKPELWIPCTLDATLFYYIRRILPRRLLLPFLFRCLPNSSAWAQTYTNKRFSA